MKTIALLWRMMFGHILRDMRKFEQESVSLELALAVAVARLGGLTNELLLPANAPCKNIWTSPQVVWHKSLALPLGATGHSPLF
jgi:hypothetical protein